MFTTNLELVNKRQYARLIALIFMVEGLVMLLPVLAALYYGERRELAGFAATSLALIAIGFSGRRFIRSVPSRMKTRDGFLFVISSMLVAIVLGAVPFLAIGHGISPVDAWFESAAAWTTTGAHVIPSSRMPYSLVLWKSEMNFMGGFVMIFLTVSIFQKLGIGGQKSVAHDIPGAKFEKLTVRMGESARILVKLYIILALLEFGLLIVSGMHPYYALVNSLSTMSTSGIIELEPVYTGFVMTRLIKFILIVFTLLASFNFVLYFMIYERHLKIAVVNYEVRMYLMIILAASAMISVSLFLDDRYDFFSCIYNSIIQTISYSSTSGFTLSKISDWPGFAKVVLLFLPIIGGCGFSTASGIKVHRAAILYKIAMRGVYKRIHPKSMKPVFINGKAVPAERASSITVQALLWFAVLVISAVIFSLQDLGIETSFSAAIASLTNNGTSFGILTGGDFSCFSAPLRAFAGIVMITGRLELYAVFVLFSRSFWDTNRATE